MTRDEHRHQTFSYVILIYFTGRGLAATNLRKIIVLLFQDAEMEPGVKRGVDRGDWTDQ